MSNIIKELLAIDKELIKVPEKIITLTLDKLEKEFDFPCRAVDAEILSELQEQTMAYSQGEGSVEMKNTFHMKTMTIIEGCPSVFKSQELADHFGVATPKDFVKYLLTAGEIDDLSNKIQVLSGFDKKKDVKKEVKN